jgi:arsenite transporter
MTMHNHSTNIFAEDELATNPAAAAPAKNSIIKSLSFLDRLLALWILLAMALGILLGCFVPNTHEVLEAATLVGVSAPIGKFLSISYSYKLAVGLIVMMYPILCKVRFEELNLVFKEKTLWRQLAFSFVANWIISPLVMVLAIQTLLMAIVGSCLGISAR